MGTTETSLTTGWEPDAPIADTLLRRFLFNWADAVTTQVTAMGGRVLRRDDLAAADLGRPAGFFNCTTLLQPLTEANRDQVLTALDAFYGFGEGTAAGEVLLFSGWPTPDLVPHGWRLEGHPPLHLLPPGRTQPLAPPGLRIEAVTDAVGLRAFEDVGVRGYPLLELQPLTPGALIDERVLVDRRLRMWVGWDGDRPVGVAAAFVEHGISDVTLVVTLPEARRRGFGEALTWRAALAEAGLPAMLLSSDPGRPVYERMGFLPLFRFTLWSRERQRGRGSAGTA